MWPLSLNGPDEARRSGQEVSFRQWGRQLLRLIHVRALKLADDLEALDKAPWEIVVRPRHDGHEDRHEADVDAPSNALDCWCQELPKALRERGASVCQFRKGFASVLPMAAQVVSVGDKSCSREAKVVI